MNGFKLPGDGGDHAMIIDESRASRWLLQLQHRSGAQLMRAMPLKAAGGQRHRQADCQDDQAGLKPASTV